MTSQDSVQLIFYKEEIAPVYRFGYLKFWNGNYEVYNATEHIVHKENIEDVVLVRNLPAGLQVCLQSLIVWDEYDSGWLQCKITIPCRNDQMVLVGMVESDTIKDIHIKHICLLKFVVEKLVEDDAVKRVPMDLLLYGIRRGGTSSTTQHDNHHPRYRDSNNQNQYNINNNSVGHGNANRESVPVATTSSGNGGNTTSHTNPEAPISRAEVPNTPRYTVEFTLRAFYKLKESRNIYRLGILQKWREKKTCGVFRGDGTGLNEKLLEDLILFSKLPVGFQVCLPISSNNSEDFYPAKLMEDVIGNFPESRIDALETSKVWDFIQRARKEIHIKDICMECDWMKNLFNWTSVPQRASAVIPSHALPKALRKETVIQYFRATISNNKHSNRKRKHDQISGESKNSSNGKVTKKVKPNNDEDDLLKLY